MSAPTLKRILPVVLLAGVAVVVIFISLTGDDSGDGAPAPAGQVWTCSMHPQVRTQRSGKCPICSMPLILTKSGAPEVKKGDGTGEEPETMLTLSEHARAMASVETVPVGRRAITHEIRAVGKVQYNESALAVINSRVEGYIEKLYVDFTGVKVKKGDHLVEIYSPDLVLAQRELLVGLEGPANNALIEASKLKLLRWGLTREQIDDLVQKRKVSERVTLYSPIDGTVTERMAVQQAMVKSGEMLYKLANLESVWVYLDIYESELGWVQQGQSARIQAEAYPSEAFTGRIWFINPVLTEESRTVKVLVNIANTEEKLKPGMFASATIDVPVLADGKAAPTGLGGRFTCPMHPQELQAKAGPCPRCGMALIVIPGSNAKPTEEELRVLAVPVSAVLDSGTRKLVYVEHSQGEFMPMEVALGPRAGEYYSVLAGLKEGDRVAVRGNFLLDSQAQISGLPSLFYEHGQAPAAGHQHGAAAEKPAPVGKPTGHEGHATPKPAEHKH